MKVGAAIAEIMKREGVEILTAYPVNHLIEYAAAADIRPIIVRQERIGLHMADAISRMTQGRKIGAFCMQHGPGTENAYGGIAQAFSESIPILVIPGGYPRRLAHVGANYNATARDARRRQIGRAADLARRGAERDAARLLAFAQRPRRPGAGRGSGRSLARGDAGSARLHAGARHPLRARGRGRARGGARSSPRPSGR